MATSRAFSVPIEPEWGSSFCFDAFSSREPVSTSLENALIVGRFGCFAWHADDRLFDQRCDFVVAQAGLPQDGSGVFAEPRRHAMDGRRTFRKTRGGPGLPYRS